MVQLSSEEPVSEREGESGGMEQGISLVVSVRFYCLCGGCQLLCMHSACFGCLTARCSVGCTVGPRAQHIHNDVI
jgi:hypothetical protein